MSSFRVDTTEYLRVVVNLCVTVDSKSHFLFDSRTDCAVSPLCTVRRSRGLFIMTRFYTFTIPVIRSTAETGGKWRALWTGRQSWSRQVSATE